MLVLFCSIVICIVSGIYLFGIIYRRTSGVCTCANQLDGKTVIITGATAGIGKEAALDLASRRARVILASIDLDEAEKVKAWIVSATGNRNIIIRHIDLSDLDSVRRFAKETLTLETRLDILINNAGIMTFNKQLSKQGYELTLATNHYGSFLLTNLLLDLITKSAPSRIINVSSSTHARFNLDLDDIHYKKRNYSGFSAYSQSKLCGILFTKELARRLVAKGVTVNALHPGMVATDIFRKEKSLMAYLTYFFRFALKNAKLGAQTTIHLAVSDKVEKVTGEYFVDCKIAETSENARDPILAIQLWKLSEEEVELT